MNLPAQEKVRRGIAEAREGVAFCLSLPLNYPGGSALNPRRKPPVLRNRKPLLNYQLLCEDPACTDVLSDDLVVLHLK